MVLGEIANINLVASLDFPFILGQNSGQHFYKGGLSLAVISVNDIEAWTKKDFAPEISEILDNNRLKEHAVILTQGKMVRFCCTGRPKQKCIYCSTEIAVTDSGSSFRVSNLVC